MARRALMAVGGLALALGCVVAAEAWRSGDRLADPRGVAAATAQQGGATVTAPPDHTASWVSTALGRPLFTPSRRPPAIVRLAKGRQNGLPRLSGIMITPTTRLAIFAPATGKPIVTNEGSRIGAFTVRAITADEVTVIGPHGVDVLHTVFSGKGDGSAAAPASAPPALAMFGIPIVAKTAGGIVLHEGKTVLPNPATWSGPPPLSRLTQPKPPPAASTPLLGKPAAAAKPQE